MNYDYSLCLHIYIYIYRYIYVLICTRYIYIYIYNRTLNRVLEEYRVISNKQTEMSSKLKKILKRGSFGNMAKEGVNII